MAKNVIIVGAPRSGTSMTALIFTRKGYFVTDDENNELQEANEFNPDGFWEASRLRQANEQLFAKAGFPYANTWLFEPITDELADKILTLPADDDHIKLVAHYNSKSPWMWKDPSLCFTIGYWWKLMEPENTGVLFLRRNPKEIYQSFLRLQWCKPDKQSREIAMRRIKHHMDYAEKILKNNNIPHIVIDYSDYDKAPEQTARRIGEYFGLEIAVEDIGFNRKYKTSGLRGRVMRLMNQLSELLPDSLRKMLKRLIPVKILKLLFPMRYTKK